MKTSFLRERSFEVLPGQYFDKETNLHYNYFRDYDPAIGRYIQSDPIGLQGGINTYLYATDPLTQIDPLGLMGQGSGAGKPRPCACPTPPAAPQGASCDANIQEAKNRSNPKWLFDQVRNYGPWDYKRQGYEQFGIFNYGATFAAFGVPGTVIQRGAGWYGENYGNYQPWMGNWYGEFPFGDDPADQAQIRAGIQCYRCGCWKPSGVR